MRCKVRRRFVGPGDVTLEPGQELDTSGWRLESQLISQRYIEPLPAVHDESRSARRREVRDV